MNTNLPDVSHFMPLPPVQVLKKVLKKFYITEKTLDELEINNHHISLKPALGHENIRFIVRTKSDIFINVILNKDGILITTDGKVIMYVESIKSYQIQPLNIEIKKYIDSQVVEELNNLVHSVSSINADLIKEENSNKN